VNTTRVVFDCPVPPWLAGLCALVALGVAVAFVRRDAAHLRPALRRLILGLVVVAGLMLAGILLSPKLIRRWPDPQKPLCSVAVDGSRSMLLRDTCSGRLLERLGGKPEADKAGLSVEVSREHLARLLLVRRPGGWLSRIEDGFDLTGLRFASSTQSLDLGEGAAPFEVDKEGYATELGKALERAGASAGGRRPRAVVLLSDGAWNAGSDPTEVARVLGRVGVPVFVLGFGSPSPPRDAAVVALRAPKSVLLGDEVIVSADIATTGIGSVRLPVQLVSGTDVLGEKQVTTLPSGRPVGVTFTFVPDAPGPMRIEVRVAKQEGEEDETNNAARAVVDVAERKIRALLVENEPRWEFRFIRNVFERDPAIEPTIALLRPRVGPIKGPGYLATLPTEAKNLAKIDLVILGDVPRDNLPDAFLKGLAEMIRLRGGALVVLAGRRGHYRGLAGTPLADILPVAVEGGQGGEARGQPFTLELTEEGAGHLVTRFAPDGEENETVWSRLPKLHWSADVGGLARGATALVVHPYRLAGASKLPLLAVQRVGAGKVMFCGIEGTWRWRKSVGDKHHYRFWAQAVRWLVKKQLAEGDPRARLSLDRTECDLGETVEVEVYCLDPGGFPLEQARVWVNVDRADGASQRLALSTTRGHWGIYRGTFTPENPGNYTLRPIVEIYGERPLASEAKLTVVRPDLEGRFLAQDVNTLSAIAQASGGQYLRVEESGGLPSLLAARVERRILTAEYSPCRHWAYYSAVALLLAVAWLIRKRSGLA